MTWTYLIIPLAVAVAVLVLVRHRRHVRTTAGLRYDGPALVLAVGDPPSTCTFCGCRVTDEITHWKAIHHVPA